MGYGRVFRNRISELYWPLEPCFRMDDKRKWNYHMVARRNLSQGGTHRCFLAFSLGGWGSRSCAPTSGSAWSHCGGLWSFLTSFKVYVLSRDRTVLMGEKSSPRGYCFRAIKESGMSNVLIRQRRFCYGQLARQCHDADLGGLVPGGWSL